MSNPQRLRLSLLLLLIIALLGVTGCLAHPSGLVAPMQAYLPDPTPLPWPARIVTPTPFRPLQPTGTWMPTPTFTPTVTPSPTPTPLPSLAELYSRRLNVLLLGSDQRPWEIGFRTDTILLVSYNPDTGATSLISFPRDLYVDIPGVGPNRINTAMFYGGFSTLAATLEQHFGVRPQYYVLIKRGQFKAIVETLGGVDIQAARMYCDYYNDGRWVCVGPGPVHLDADMALWYARARKNSNDLDRNRRQQEVVLGLMERVLSLDGLRRAPELYAQLRGLVTETNIGLNDILAWLPHMQQFDPNQVYRYPMTRAQVIPWTTPGGGQVLLPNGPAIEALLRAAAQH